MSIDPNDEDTTKRQVIPTDDATFYRRVYRVAPDTVLDVPGDVMPGETAALLGPYIEKDGISSRPDGDCLLVSLKCKTLIAVTASSTFPEIAGSPDDEKANDRLAVRHYLQWTPNGGSHADNIPAPGTYLTGDTAPLGRTVADVHRDRDAEPQREVITVTFAGERARA